MKSISCLSLQCIAAIVYTKHYTSSNEENVKLFRVYQKPRIRYAWTRTRKFLFLLLLLIGSFRAHPKCKCHLVITVFTKFIVYMIPSNSKFELNLKQLLITTERYRRESRKNVGHSLSFLFVIIKCEQYDSKENLTKNWINLSRKSYMDWRDVLSTKKVQQKCPKAKYYIAWGDSSYKKN